MNVLSLFDGMSGAQVALKKLGITPENYFASEIDSYAIKVTQKNFPNTIKLGDVTKITASELPQIDLLVGGSPCQSFSVAGKGEGFDGKSKLFWEYVRILEEVKPKYFILENVRMKKEWEDVITNALGVNPIFINSNLVSAQTRKRLYWTNIPNITLPEDRGIKLKDIVEGEGVRVETEKSNAIIASIGRTTPREYFGRHQGQMVFVDRDKSHCLDANYYKGINWQQYLSKSRRQLVIDFIDGDYLVRKLTPLECERLQTFPDSYTKVEGISNTQRYKMLGNGFTADVIAHILGHIPIW
jgi:DNA (cytosine-5)-methyltransferase 3A